MSITERVDRWQRRFPRVGFPIATIYKFGDDQGNYLAALMTYYAFVSLLPMLLLASTGLSFLLVGHPDLQATLLRSALAQFPVVGEQLRAPKALGGGTAGIIVGVVGAVYGALGAAQALQYAGNTVWQVPRNNRPNPFAARGKSILLVATSGLGLLVILIVSTTVSNALDTGTIGTLLLFLLSVAMFSVIFVFAFRMAPNADLSVRQVLGGAVFAALLFRLLQTFGSTYVANVVRHASTTNAVFAVVLGMLAYLYLSSVIVVLAMEVDVVRARRLWPRALLTPFTDEVDLTHADMRTYRGQAMAQRHKGFEEIQVHFHDRDRNPPDSQDSADRASTAEDQ
ncbi:MAG: YihY/virulence factor BrkB family protein [Actinomycetota bacterium]|nr:YihY/virulence factor BrkB family protein [Actinomycetota bacterium]